MFNVFDTDKNGHLDIVEFIEGMTILFSESYDRLVPFIFRLYDFDRDDYISREDIKTVISYVHINTKKNIPKYKLKYEK